LEDLLQQWQVCVTALSGQFGKLCASDPMDDLLLDQRDKAEVLHQARRDTAHRQRQGRLVSGGMPGGRGSEVHTRRWWKRTRLHSLVSFEVLFRFYEDLDVILFLFLVLQVFCTHRLE
jgi:hypothetical protein